MNIRMEPVDRKNKRVKEIYMEAFPKKERMSYWMMLLMAKMEHTDFLAAYDGDKVCGLVYMAVVDKITFIMFLAVDSRVRSKGCGSQILSCVQERYPDNAIIVSIERCDEDAENREQRLRRKRFYLDNGYQETGYLAELSKVKQEILIKNGVFDQAAFSSFFKTYSNGAMKINIWKA